MVNKKSQEKSDLNLQFQIENFNRKFLDPFINLGGIGQGSLGGKAQGLVSILRTLQADCKPQDFAGIGVEIPRLIVIRTDVFDHFILDNHLNDITDSDSSFERISQAFQNSQLPLEVLGDLRALIEKVHCPLAIRSSSLLEDSTHSPFAGIYETKMIPNHQYDPDERFQHLIEAIKFVYLSTFAQKAKEYRKVTGFSNHDEKMAVIIQEVAGQRYHNRFYPELSGIARSYNYYPLKPAKPEEGVVSLALGLGKTIVDGGVAWVYSPAYPMAESPHDSPKNLLDFSQTQFWAVNMGKEIEYNPLKETEFLLHEDLAIADRDGALRYLASTYDAQADRFFPGISFNGPRVLTFAPLLVLTELPFNNLVKWVLNSCEKSFSSPVEIEFAMTFNPHRFYLLQVRPMAVPSDEVSVTDNDLIGEKVLASSEIVLGNGEEENIRDIVYIKPENFDILTTASIVSELAELNSKMLDLKKPYLLIVFGRLGTTNPTLGIPIRWEQVNGAKVIVETTQEQFRVELSQGMHYFLNLINLGVKYFTLPVSGPYKIDWDWLSLQPVFKETKYLRHVILSKPIHVKVDGRKGKGVIYKS